MQLRDHFDVAVILGHRAARHLAAGHAPPMRPDIPLDGGFTHAGRGGHTSRSDEGGEKPRHPHEGYRTFHPKVVSISVSALATCSRVMWVKVWWKILFAQTASRVTGWRAGIRLRRGRPGAWAGPPRG